MTIGDDPTGKGKIGTKFSIIDVPFIPQNEENNLMAYSKTGYYHIHGASFLYPDKADPIELTSNAAAWNETGTIVEVIPANTIIKDFDLHWASISNISAVLNGVIDVFAGESGSEVKIGAVDVVRTINQSRDYPSPLQIPQQPANTRISCRFTDNTTSSRTVEVKFYGHVYGTSLT